MDKIFKKISRIVNASRNVVLTTHLIPDGDAIGSEIAMCEYLKLKGKKVYIINHSETPEHLVFLDKHKVIRRFLDNSERNIKIINKSDLIIVLDTNEYSRTKSMEEALRNSKAKKICIDHHIGIDKISFDAFVSDSGYPATSQMLFDFFSEDNVKLLNKTMAEGLYAGIMTDTGSFRYPRTGEKTFRISAELIKRGADPVAIYDRIYCNIPTDKVKLFARFINSLTFHFNNTVAYGVVSQRDFGDFHSDIKDVEGFSGYLMSMKGIKSGFLVVELRDGAKISFRSKGNIKINEFAGIFGGGGHKNAAGASVAKTDLDELKDVLLSRYGTFIRKPGK
ncbi:MAG: bifunctional oligoribonuclease/PAP phosphatase NrnA [Ignavibacteriae bacterium]|jgi:phosphoesterase RecJ-like protein|nr:bifunctional oligoribonuclease/PAP phosphatase NrnA [Ignavibacteriota bacterium]